MISYRSIKGIVVASALLVLPLAACHKEEQAVVGVAKNAEKAEHQAQATATVLDQERAQLAQIPLPTKSMYVDIHDPSKWVNPFLTVGPDTVSLRIYLPDTNPSAAGKGSMLRPESARRQEVPVRIDDLGKAIAAIPDGAWPYGRVVAVAESPTAAAKDRPAVRRNVEAVIQKLNDLGVVVEEWPSK